ncbi:hypothetical protein CLV63_103136 [Murinocardiopsis flavida]|uniref:DNA-binding protein n=1 Tax=Murinocardiopsis flavida TaxID=645275 RepID=A0A2P8DQE5_9ACTN|nr:DNA-binding protein [Murinocardiopsis flavida]PSK99412.1 hypothetical protein CLV63_103136 [Murinocardiopsis flavida]
MTDDPFTRPDPDAERQKRVYTALFRITERHASGEAKARWDERHMPMEPLDAIRRVANLAGGSGDPEPGAPPVDTADLTAALSLAPRARAEVEALEAGLIDTARGRGMTWQEIAFGLGLNSAQAARQRYERLTERTAGEIVS